jgi:signal transduction histidine kinase
MSELVEDLLELAAVGYREVTFTKLDLSAIARTCADRLAGAGGERLRITVEPGMAGRANAELMRMLFDNLIGNAVKFSAKVGQPAVTVGSFTEQGRRVYFVRDNGVGFDQSKAERIFEPFTRLHSPREYAGTGIGLAIVQKIIDRHKGRIWAVSRQGGGASFYFTLGVEEEPPRS